MIDDQVLINNIITLSSRIALAHEELMSIRHESFPESMDELCDRIEIAMGYLEGDADPAFPGDDDEEFINN